MGCTVYVTNARIIYFQLNRVKVAEKDKDDLEGPKNEAIEYLSTENEIARKRHVQYQKYM